MGGLGETKCSLFNSESILWGNSNLFYGKKVKQIQKDFAEQHRYRQGGISKVGEVNNEASSMKIMFTLTFQYKSLVI